MADDKSRAQGPGLKWRKRATGSDVPYWFADRAAAAAGYPVKSANLSEYADDNRRLVERAQRLQSEMLLWLSGQRRTAPVYDGTFKSLLDIYQTNPRSSYFTNCNENTRRSYDVYIPKLIHHIGALRIDHCDGTQVCDWFDLWRKTNSAGVDQLGSARMSLAILKAAVRFGVVCRAKGCIDFRAIMDELEFEMLEPRTQAPTAEQIIAARKAAHANGAPLRALCYAIQFETTLRQWDVTGQWIPLADPRPSLITFGGRKWIGPMWSWIVDGKLKIKPTKTEETTGIEVTFDLAACPMVMEEMALIDPKKCTGPLIVSPTGRPYTAQAFREGWRTDAVKAGLPKALQNRDIRAGGITEGGKAGASKDDRRKLAGHAKEQTTEIYDRDQVEAHRRVMQSRRDFREKNTP